jgi:hypothetical protein
MKTILTIGGLIDYGGVLRPLTYRKVEVSGWTITEIRVFGIRIYDGRVS